MDDRRVWYHASRNAIGNADRQMHGFQLWANLPRSKKLVQPRYQDVNSSDIPLLEDDDGSKIKVVVGDYKGIIGPVDGIAADPQYLDVYVPPHKDKRIKMDA